MLLHISLAAKLRICGEMHEWSGESVRAFFTASSYSNFINWDERAGASHGGANLDNPVLHDRIHV